MSNEMSEKEKVWEYYCEVNYSHKDDINGFDKSCFSAGWDARNAIPAIDKKKLIEWICSDSWEMPQNETKWYTLDRLKNKIDSGEFDV